jgi:uncharacterized protein YbjT (DUF2867 family)
MAKTAWIAGASGLVGGFALDGLIADPAYERVVSFGRRPSGRTSDKLVEKTVDFAAFDAGDAPAPDVAVCSLGTTIKKAGSKEAFRAVDHDAVLAFAKAAKAAGADTFVIVTAHGADAGSTIFYNRVKGEIEAALEGLGFTSLAIARPSLLLGDRAENRPGEKIAAAAARLLEPLIAGVRIRPIEGEVVARAVLAMAKNPEPGVRVVHSGDLHDLV